MGRLEQKTNRLRISLHLLLSALSNACRRHGSKVSPKFLPSILTGRHCTDSLYCKECLTQFHSDSGHWDFTSIPGGPPRPIRRGQDPCLSPSTTRGPITSTITSLLRHLTANSGRPGAVFHLSRRVSPNSFRFALIHHCPVAEKARKYSGAPPLRRKRPHEACSGQLATSPFFSQFAQWRLSLPSLCLPTPLRPPQHLAGIFCSVGDSLAQNGDRNGSQNRVTSGSAVLRSRFSRENERARERGL